MNNLDIAGILSTYSIKASKTTDREKLKDLIRELKSEFDLRNVTGRTEIFFSAEDVRKMSPGEVRENYQAIMRSMEEWK